MDEGIFSQLTRDQKRIWISVLCKRPNDYASKLDFWWYRAAEALELDFQVDQDEIFLSAETMIQISEGFCVDDPGVEKESAAVYALYVALLKELWGISEDELTAQQLPDAINTA